MASSSSSSDPRRTSEVAQIVAEWRERLQRAEPIDLNEYTAKHLEIAEELRDLYPAIAMIEDLKSDVNNLTGSIGAGAVLPEGKVLERLGDYRILREVEAPLLSAALPATRGNQIRAADLLGVNRNTLRKKIRDLEIQMYRSGGG